MPSQESINAAPDDAVYSTDHGLPFPGHPYEAQIAGRDGPLLMQDYHMFEVLAHFDRERIPERVVHAKGGGAHGEFRVTDSIDDLCKARLFSKAGNTAPLTIRFSTVAGESGASDLARDPRGFAIKIRTDEGNLDWVFNNTPVFFIRDPTKFPHFIHSQKRDPQTHLVQFNGDDTTLFWDYGVQNPEILHQYTVLFGDRGIPSSWAEMHGYSGHTYKMVNNDNEMTYVKVHVKARAGFHTFTTEEAGKRSPDYLTKDLFERIESGKHPLYDVYVQTMTPKQAESFKYSILDLTKVWSQKQFPLRKFGEITLNKNVENYFAEIEQIAFSPAHVVPGWEPSNDPVLQSRLFSYTDTHNHRLGVNHAQLPVNRPRCPFGFGGSGNFQRDGSMAYDNQGFRPNYQSMYRPMQYTTRPEGYANGEGNARQNNKVSAFDYDKHDGMMRDGVQFYLSHIHEKDFDQPRTLYTRVMDDAARERFVNNIVGHANSIKVQCVKEQVPYLWALMDRDLATKIAHGLGVPFVPGGSSHIQYNVLAN